VLGEAIRVGTRDHVIIGVAPRGFVGVSEATSPAVFIPITSFPIAAGENKVNDYYTRYNWDWVTVIARRKAQVTEAAATTDLTHAYIASRAAQRAITPSVLPDSIAHPRAIAGAIRTPAGPAAGLESRTLLWVTGVAAIVLVIACANVANLMLARMLRRRREIAVRIALGVRRSRLVAQIVLESIVLAGAGCLAGVLIAQWGGIAFRRLVLPQESTLAIVTDWRTLLTASLIALLAGLATGVTPAMLAIRRDLADAFKSGAREGTRQRSTARSFLLVLQAALSVVLLIGAHLFVRSLDHVRSLRLGYDPAPVLMVMTEMRGLRLDSANMVTLRRRLLATAREIPGVVAASRVNSRPFGTNTAKLIVPGIDSVERLGRFNFQVADPDYFTVMDTRIVRGPRLHRGRRRTSSAGRRREREHGPRALAGPQAPRRVHHRDLRYRIGRDANLQHGGRRRRGWDEPEPDRRPAVHVLPADGPGESVVGHPDVRAGRCRTGWPAR
jgi:hypothetical protein